MSTASVKRWQEGSDRQLHSTPFGLQLAKAAGSRQSSGADPVLASTAMKRLQQAQAISSQQTRADVAKWL